MLEPGLRELLLTLRAEARRQGVEAVIRLHREWSSLIRLANGAVALSTSEALTRLDIRVREGRRSGAFSLTADIVSLAQCREVLERARAYCAVALEKEYDPLPVRLDEELTVVDEDARLAALSAGEKAAFCAGVIRAIGPEGDFAWSGSWSSGVSERYLLSTEGEGEAFHRITDGKLTLVLRDRARKWELYAAQGGKTADAFSAERMIDEFRGMLPLYGSRPGYRPPLGRGRVLFGPQAIAQLVRLGVGCGFSGREWEERRAYTARHATGDALFSPLVTLADDPADPRVFGMPFDGEGRRRRRFPLVENGRFAGLCYDADTAARYGKAPTGHDLANPDYLLAPGDASAGTDAGAALAGDALYIPYLHYANITNPSRGMITGSSRFNARRVAGGEFAAPLVSSRVTDTVPTILGNVVALSSHAVLVNLSATSGRRAPQAFSVPEYLLCDDVRISDAADEFV